MANDKNVTYTYPRLHKMFPDLYEGAFAAMATMVNVQFSLQYMKYINLSLGTEKHIEEEYSDIKQKLEKNTASPKIKKPYPIGFAVSDLGGLVMYDTIRRMKPEIVLETGVANGYSTYIILSALNKNRRGKLISVEISKNVGGLLQGLDKSRWTLIVGKPKENLKAALKTVKKIDVFIHDGDHKYDNVKWELEKVYPMVKGGVMMSDDVNWDAYVKKSAFMDFAEKIRKPPRLFPISYKTFGFLKV